MDRRRRRALERAESKRAKKQPAIPREPLRSLDTAAYAILLAVLCAVPIVFSFYTLEVVALKVAVLGILVLAAGTLWILSGLRRGHTDFTSSLLNVAVLAYWGAACVAAVFSRCTRLSLQGLWRVTVFVLLYLLVANAVRTRPRVLGILAGAAAAAVWVTAHGFLQVLGHDPVNWSFAFEGRPFASLGNPNILAGYLIIAIHFTIALTGGASSWPLRLSGTAAGFCCLVCLALTQSKAAWLALLISGAVMGFCVVFSRLPAALKWTRVRKVLAAVISCLIVVSALLLAPAAVKRFHATWRGSTAVRLVYWQGALGMFKSRPLMGAGIGTFHALFPQYRPPTFQSVSGAGHDTRHAHSEYVETLAERGVIGIGALLFLLCAITAVGLKALRKAESVSDRWILCGLLSGVAGLLAHGAVSVALRYVVCPTYFWVALGLIVAMQHIALSDRGRRQFRLLKSVGLRILLAVVSVCIIGYAAHALVIRPFRARLALREAFRLETIDRPDQAITAFKCAIERDKLDPRPYYHLAETYRRKRDYERAIRTYHALQTFMPDYLHIHCQLGSTYAAMNQWDKAGPEFLLALRQGALPDGVRPMPLIRKLRQKQKWDDARYAEILQELAEVYPTDETIQETLKDFAPRRLP